MMTSSFKIAGIGFLVILCLWFAGFLTFAGYINLMYPRSLEKTTDAVVVLTGGSQRIEEGLFLFAEGRARHLYVTGVHPSVSQDQITSLWRGDHALPPCCISLDRKARTTSQNVFQAKTWFAEHDYITMRLVTSDYHMPRAYLEFQHVMPDLQIIPHPIKQNDFNIDDFYYWQIVFSEYHKIIYRQMQILLGLYQLEETKET